MEITLECGHRPAAMGCSVDDRGVELDLAEHVRLPAAADARIGGIGLDDLRARFDRVESRATARENAHAGRKRGGTAHQQVGAGGKVERRPDRRDRVFRFRPHAGGNFSAEDGSTIKAGFDFPLGYTAFQNHLGEVQERANLQIS